MMQEQVAFRHTSSLALRRTAPVVFAATCFLWAVSPAGAKATITTFDPSGSVDTYASSINSSGSIAGYYVDANGMAHGYVRAADGTITTFDPEGSTGTYASGINKSGAIVGTYVDAKGASRGFVRAPDGAISTWRVKPQGTPSGTDASCINDKGVVAGGYWWWNLLEYVGVAYLRMPGGRITSLSTGGLFASSAGINRAGWIAGSVENQLRATWSDGFVSAPDGTVTEFNVLGMPYSTYANGINDPGSVVGNYVDGSNVSHGYVRAADGTITNFDVPQSTGTDIYSINDKGWIAGNFADSNGVSHGFAEINGKLSRFDPSGSTGTFAYSMNNRGSITGDYTDGNGEYHGFIRTP